MMTGQGPTACGSGEPAGIRMNKQIGFTNYDAMACMNTRFSGDGGTSAWHKLMGEHEKPASSESAAYLRSATESDAGREPWSV